MDCKDVQGEIAALLYGELDAEEAQSLRAHIEACADCGREIKRHEQVLARLDLWPDVDAPLDPARVVESARRGSSGFHPLRAPYLNKIAVAAAAMLLVAATLAVIGIEVRHTGKELVVTFGRSEAGEMPMVAESVDLDVTLQSGIRRVVSRELEGDIWNLLEVVGRRIDDLSREQERQRVLLARAVLLQREEDMRYTRNLFQRVAQETANESERNRLRLDEIARFVQPADGGLPIEKQ